jgi:general nucleoside transport system permease protein
MSGSAIWTLDFWEAVFSTGIRLAVPLALAALGELIGERAGVLNLGVGGTMAVGAFAGVVGADTFGVTVGLLVGAVAGALFGALFALLVVMRGANEIVVGFGFALGGLALPSFLYRGVYDTRPSITPHQAVDITLLSDLPVAGPILFTQPLLVWLMPLVAGAIAFVMTRTSAGLAVRAVGDGPEAARAKGIPVDRTRTLALSAAGSLAGLGGAVLSVGLVGEYSDEIIGGRGFVALALVIAASWRPWLLVVLCLAVGSLQGFQLRAQSLDIGVPVELFQALPFVVTLIVLAFGVGAARAPRALGRLTRA